MVRLVFRRLTHVRRTICTSVSLRASTRVSSGFTLARAKFTIFRVPSCMLRLDPILRKVGRCCGLAAWHHSLSFRTWVFHPNTRTHNSLLGPCFKTGGMGPFRQHAEHADGASFAEPFTRVHPAKQTYSPESPGPLASSPRRAFSSTVQADVCSRGL